MQYAVGIQSASGLLACDSPSTFKYPFRSPREAGVASGPPATAACTPAYGFLEGPRIEIVTATFNPARRWQGCLLLTAYCLLLTAYCLLLTAYCLLLTSPSSPPKSTSTPAAPTRSPAELGPPARPAPDRSLPL